MSEATKAPPVHGTIGWNELLSTDPAAAKTFYSGLLGWTFGEMEMAAGTTYTVCKNGDKDICGLMELPADAKAAGAPSHWLNYICVDDLDVSTGKVAGLGGTIIVPPTEIPNMGRFSIIQDPTGGVFGIWQGTGECCA